MASEISVTVVYGGIDPIHVEPLTVATGTTAGELSALLRTRTPYCEWPWHGLANYGEWLDDKSVLQDGDRVEWLMPLKLDPKDARRRRVQSHPRKR